MGSGHKKITPFTLEVSGLPPVTFETIRGLETTEGGVMPDTGKMERLFHQCTSSILFPKDGETMIYPEGDLDGIAEQISLALTLAEERLVEAHKIADEAEQRTAYVVGEVRRAHKSLDGALKGASVAEQVVREEDDFGDFDDEDDPPCHPKKGKKKPPKKRRF